MNAMSISDAGPDQKLKSPARKFARRIWRDERRDDTVAELRRDQTEDGRELQCTGVRAVAALVRNLERPVERLNDGAEKRGSNRKAVTAWLLP